MSTALGLRSSLARVSRAGARYASVARGQRVQTKPNPTMENDPSLLLLLRDVDHAVKGAKTGKKGGKGPLSTPFGLRPVQTAEFVEVEADMPVSLEAPELDLDADDGLYDSERKAPAALIGGIKAKCISLPYELVAHMNEIIEESDKRQLRSDAKRLYERVESDDESSEWTMDDPEYKSRKQAQDRAYRDGLAYAAVVMPLHYSSIYNVLKQIDLRFGPSFKVTNIVDMGCHAGEALWAAREVFAEDEESRVKNYFGVDPRTKMLYMGERLIQDVSLYGCNATFHAKLSQALPGGLTPEAAAETLIVNAFDLSRHARWRDRRDRLYEMWQTGAETIVLIEAGTREGYEFIAEAREYLLRLGLVEAAEARHLDADAQPAWAPGMHVAMPCPHDRPCAVLPELKFTCAFGQQFEAPQFTRDTRHAPGHTHDTAKHSYVVLRRGPRPESPGTALGRVGLVGRRWEEKQHARRPTELLETTEGDERVLVPEVKELPRSVEDDMPVEELQDALRKEAMFWPRLNMPPLKKAGHIVMDACTRDGSIQRLTISRSRGKQEFYDARKSSWGDSFPHEPTIPPVLRFRAYRRPANFDPEESALAAMELVLGEQRRKQNEGMNKWNRNERRDRAHEDRRQARKESRSAGL